MTMRLCVASDGVDVRIELKRLRSLLASRLRAFHRVRRRIVSDPTILSGEPVFEETRIPLAHIAGLFAKNVPVEEIHEDYPSLGEDDLLFAAMVARMKPGPGRPRKPLALLRSEEVVRT